MITNICPACGYPTLDASLCAFCCPGEVRAGNQGLAPASFQARSFQARPLRESAWLQLKDSDSYSYSAAARARIWPGPLAS